MLRLFCYQKGIDLGAYDIIPHSTVCSIKKLNFEYSVDETINNADGIVFYGEEIRMLMNLITKILHGIKNIITRN